MLSTPFGNIKVFADDTEIEYEAKWFKYIKPPVKDKPLAGCYRIHINGKVEKVAFGIAWATDYAGKDDVRVWFAADPTVYFR